MVTKAVSDTMSELPHVLNEYLIIRWVFVSKMTATSNLMDCVPFFAGTNITDLDKMTR